MIRDFWQAVKGRRTYYSLAKESPISEERLRSIIENAVLHTPTAFNSQSGRVLVVTGEQTNALWDIVEAALRKIVPADAFGPTEEKIAAFRKAYGSVLFFEDQTVVKGLQERFPLYQKTFQFVAACVGHATVRGLDGVGGSWLWSIAAALRFVD
jgi:predicted oxidoreductase (fatty acid repression mutant protein)